MAPIAVFDASKVIENSFEKSGYANTGAFVINSLSLLNASVYSGFSQSIFSLFLEL